MIIAFTSDFIPRLVYTLHYSPDHSLRSYVNYTLAYFDTSHFAQSERIQSNATSEVTICRYAPSSYYHSHRHDIVFGT